MVGPIVFVIIEAGIERGFLSGFMAACGIWLSDLLFIGFTYSFITKLIPYQDSVEAKYWLGLAGGIILLIVGIGTLIKASSKKTKLFPKPYIYPNVHPNLNYFVKGFLVNTINPFTVFFWISVMAGLSAKQELDQSNGYFLIAGIMLTLFVTDVLKIYFASYLKKKLSEDFVIKIRRVAGFAFIVFGIVLICSTLFV